MKGERVIQASILGLAALGGFLVSWSSGPDPPRGGCRSGETTQLVADHCANVWPAESARFKWPDLDASCVPGSLVCDSIKDSIPKALDALACRNVRVVSAIPLDHLALIECTGPGSGSDQRYYVNADALACGRTNVTEYSSPPSGPAKSPTEVGRFLVDQAELRMAEIQEKADADIGLLLGRMEQIPSVRLYALLKKAQEEIGDLLTEVCDRLRFTFACEPTDGHEVRDDDNEVRAQRTCRLLRFTYGAGTRLLGHAGAPRNPLGLKRYVRRNALLANENRPNDALSTRMLLFYGLKELDPELPQELHLIRKSVETGIHDPEEPSHDYFWELHSGFVYGGRRLGDNSGGGYDCTDFLSSLLTHPETSSQEISTWKLKRIARHLAHESIGEPLSRSERRLESCFSVVRPRKGEGLQTGDIVISNSRTLDTGHAALVRRPLAGQTVETIEAAGGGNNAVMYKRRPLLEPQPQCPMPEDRLPVRSDLYFLRVKASRPRSCPLVLDDHQAISAR